MGRAAAIGLSRLPGNTPWESALIQKWIQEEGAPFTGFDFNVRIGTGLDPGPAFDDTIRRGSILNTQKRIDCLAYTAEGVFIVEGKIIVDLTVMGQFLGYRHLLERDSPDVRVLGYVVVAHGSTPDTLQFLRTNGVFIYLYPSVVAPA
jgi:hypothetical protein